MAPEGIFGVPHGILSSTDEWIGFGIGLVALLFAVFYDGELDLRPVVPAALVGIAVALLGSLVAPSVVTEEWHIPVVVVVSITLGVVVARLRR